MDSQREWKAPRELMRSLPREVRLSKSGIGLTVVAVVFLIAAVVAGVLLGQRSAKESAERKELLANGVKTEAAITRLWRRDDKEHQPMVSYQFRLNDSIYRHTTSTSLSIWKSLSEGSTMMVLYDPSRPQNSMPADWKGDGPLPVVVPVLVALMPTFGGLLLLWQIARQKRLLAEGRTAMGVITGYHNTGHGQKVPRYDFKLPGGTVVKGRGRPARKAPGVGSVVTVLYDPEKPSRNTSYPMEMVRIDDLS